MAVFLRRSASTDKLAAQLRISTNFTLKGIKQAGPRAFNFMTQHINDTGKEFQAFLAEKPAVKYFDFNFPSSSRTGSTTINVLGFLKGLPLDNLAMSYIHALRPSRVEVIRGEEKCVGWSWLVRVYLDSNDLITHINQQVEVAFASGYTIDNELRRRGRRTS